MEHHKISKLLNDSIVSKFATRKWIEVNNLSGGQYSVNKNIKLKVPTLRSNLCDYNDTYIVVKRKIDLEVVGDNNMTQKGVVFQNNAPFRSCISKINNTFIDNAEDLDTVMPMYNLLEYSDNYFMTSEKL